jgi:MFS family permease
LMAFHFEKADALATTWIPIMYAIAMAISGLGLLVFGRLFDRVGIGILIPLTAAGALFAPLVFLDGFWGIAAGTALWGLGMGVHESIVPAAVGTMVPPQRRPSAYGILTAGCGTAWFAGSAVMRVLYDRSIVTVVVFCVALQLAAIPFLFAVRSTRSHVAR